MRNHSCWSLISIQPWTSFVEYDHQLTEYVDFSILGYYEWRPQGTARGSDSRDNGISTRVVSVYATTQHNTRILIGCVLNRSTRHFHLTLSGRAGIIFQCLVSLVSLYAAQCLLSKSNLLIITGGNMLVGRFLTRVYRELLKYEFSANSLLAFA